jgi:hypothetical protein
LGTLEVVPFSRFSVRARLETGHLPPGGREMSANHVWWSNIVRGLHSHRGPPETPSDQAAPRLASSRLQAGGRDLSGPALLDKEGLCSHRRCLGALGAGVGLWIGAGLSMRARSVRRHVAAVRQDC